MERVFTSWVRGYEMSTDLVRLPRGKTVAAERSVLRSRVMPAGFLLLAGMALSLLPRYRATLGVWTLAVGSYLMVFLFSQMNVRYFGPAWPVLIVLCALPADVLVTAIVSRRKAARREPREG